MPTGPLSVQHFVPPAEISTSSDGSDGHAADREEIALVRPKTLATLPGHVVDIAYHLVPDSRSVRAGFNGETPVADSVAPIEPSTGVGEDDNVPKLDVSIDDRQRLNVAETGEDLLQSVLHLENGQLAVAQ